MRALIFLIEGKLTYLFYFSFLLSWAIAKYYFTLLNAKIRKTWLN